jgi:hypothetical protein
VRPTSPTTSLTAAMTSDSGTASPTTVKQGETEREYRERGEVEDVRKC